MRGAQSDTDHRLVRATIHLEKIVYKKKKSPSSAFNGRCLQNEETKKKFNEILTVNKPDINNINVEEARTLIKHLYNSTA
ncbi:hypothetical protein M8J76_012339 [Diaphorina citri]|nr:hypothetical protein M8J76_012339 [Diaphorina citri]